MQSDKDLGAIFRRAGFAAIAVHEHEHYEVRQAAKPPPPLLLFFFLFLGGSGG